MTAYRMGFHLLEQLAQQAALIKGKLFSSRTRQAIEDGDVHVIRSQWCAYLPSSDVSTFLQVLTVLFDQTIAHGRGIIQLASHLGFRCTVFHHPTYCSVTGVMLQKRQGTKLQYSHVFYDKAVRVAQMHQGQSLTEIEATTVRDNVRFDISVHSAGVLTLIGEARRWLPRLIEENPERFGLPERFLTEQPQPTVWWLERTIWVLSHTKTKDRSRQSFGSWLVPKMLREVLRLDRIAGFTADNLEALLRQNDKVVAAWRKIDCVEDDWAGVLAQAAKCTKEWVYKRRKALLAFCSIDIALPFAFYRDLVFFGPNSLTRPEDRSALNTALARGDAATNLRLRQQAAKDFDRVRVDVVGAAVKSPPLLMSPKVAVVQMSDEQEEVRGVGQPAKQLAPKKK